MRKFSMRIIVYLSLPLLLWVAMMFGPHVIASATWNAVFIYVPLSLFFFLFFRLTGYELWTDHTLGFPTKRVLQTMIGTGFIGSVVAAVLSGETLANLSMLLVLGGIEGLLNERERKASASRRG